MDAGGTYPIINGETGAMLAGVPYAKGLRVPRSKMRALCAEGIDVQVCCCCVHTKLLSADSTVKGPKENSHTTLRGQTDTTIFVLLVW